MTIIPLRPLAFAAVLLMVCGFAVAEDTNAATDPLHDAVRRGRNLVATAGTNWLKNKSCFACHHQTLPLLTLVETSRFGFPDDPDWIAAQAEHTHRYFQDRVEGMRKGEHVPGGASSAGFGLWAMKLTKQPADEVTAATVEYLLLVQGVVRLEDRDANKTRPQKEGAWLPSCRRPPLQGSDIATTVLTLFGIEHYATDEQRPRVAAARAAAETWLNDAPQKTSDDRAWRLWGLSQLNGDATKIETTRAAILKAQRDDGGWSETDDRPSDAYSTGETLFILLQTGTPPSDPAVLRARDYLLKTQHTDGSWLVETHVKPVQTFFENGDPHGKHQFLSTAATAWSTAALAQLLPMLKPQVAASRDAGGLPASGSDSNTIPAKVGQAGSPPHDNTLQVGVAETDITPPVGFPMAGYYHERLAEGSIDPLKAKAIVFRSANESAALVACDLIGIATDLSREVRKRASEKTGIPAANIVITATHSHTAPDYMKELYLSLGGELKDPLRGAYIDKLINGPVEAIVKAAAAAKPVVLEAGSATQETAVSFNRRFVMRDGSVKTWQAFSNPDVVRSAGPIDPEISLLKIREPSGPTLGIVSNFALHLDTVGGAKWSADYPYFIEQTLRKAAGADVISIFGTGCCGDINHSNPRAKERNKADFIGGSIGESIQRQLDKLTPLERPNLVVKSRTIRLPLQAATKDEVANSIGILDKAKRKETVDFLEHVTAYKKLILDQLRHREPHANTVEHITWGLSRSLAGVGETLPVDVTVMTLGRDVAIVCLPGEVFVELGLAIKQGSPFRTTLVIELSNHVETIYVPNRAAYASGSYEVTNSNLQPGSGEMLVETGLTLLREAASTKP